MPKTQKSAKIWRIFGLLQGGIQIAYSITIFCVLTSSGPEPSVSEPVEVSPASLVLNTNLKRLS